MQHPRRPSEWLGVAATVILLVLAVPILGLRTGMPSITVVPEGDGARVGYEQVQKAFGVGAPGSLQLVGPTADVEAAAKLAASDTASIAFVSPVQPGGGGLGMAQAIPTVGPNDPALGDIIDNLSGVMEGLAARGDQLETLLTQTRTLLTGLYEQGQSLQNSTVQLADSTTAIVNMVGQVQPKLAQTQRSANDAIGMLISHGAQLDQTAISAPTLLTDLARITSNGAFATAYVCDLDVSLWGVLLPERWFSTVSDMIFGQRHSEVCR